MKRVLIISIFILIVSISLIYFKSSFKNGVDKPDSISIAPYYSLDDLLLIADNVVKVKATLSNNVTTFFVTKVYKGSLMQNEYIDNISTPDGVSFDKNCEYLFFLSKNNPLNDMFYHVFPDAILDISSMKTPTKFGDNLFNSFSSFSSLENVIESYDKLNIIFMDRISDKRFVRNPKSELHSFCTSQKAYITDIEEVNFTYQNTSLTSYYVYFTLDSQNKYVISLDFLPSMSDISTVYMYTKDGHVYGTLYQ